MINTLAIQNVHVGELAALGVCFLLSGFFSGSEAVLMSLGIDRAKQLIEEGGKKGQAMTFMLERPNELLATILVGNNIANILAATLTTTIVGRYFQSEAVGISTGITTFIILIFGEVLPKTFARTHAETLSLPIIYILRLIYYLLYPLVKLIVWVIHTLLGDKAELKAGLVTKNDIEYMVNRAEQDQSIDSKQLDLLSSILEFPTIKVKDIMTPRSEVKYIQRDWSFQKIIEFASSDTHSRYPVCEGGLDHTVGLLHIKELALVRGTEKVNFHIDRFLKEPFFVYEHMKIQAVFDYMNRKKIHLALVKNENGLVMGIVTLEDIVEEILGEIQDEHDVEEETLPDQNIKQGVIVEGTLLLRDLYNDYDIKVPLNDHYSTVAGFLLDMLGNTFPKQGQIIVWEGLTFQIKSVEAGQIGEVKIQDAGGEKHIYNKREKGEEDVENGGKMGKFG